MIQSGEAYECLEPRESGRTVRVQLVMPADLYGLKKSSVLVTSRGKATVFDLNRMLDKSRFRKVDL